MQMTNQKGSPPAALFRPEKLALCDGNVGAGIGGADIVRARADEAIVVVLLNYVGCPAGDAADGEDRREEVNVDAQRGVSGGGVEVNVGVDPKTPKPLMP